MVLSWTRLRFECDGAGLPPVEVCRSSSMSDSASEMLRLRLYRVVSNGASEPALWPLLLLLASGASDGSVDAVGSRDGVVWGRGTEVESEADGVGISWGRSSARTTSWSAAPVEPCSAAAEHSQSPGRSRPVARVPAQSISSHPSRVVWGAMDGFAG